MLKNHFKIALRSLFKNKGYSLLNIGGLSVGMAAAMLILLWVQHEVSYDMFHSKKDRLYKAMNLAVFNGKLQAWDTTPKILGPTMAAEFPEVANMSRFSNQGGLLMRVGDQQLLAEGAFVDSAFVDMFDFPLLSGDHKHVLRQPTDVLISESLAQKLFGRKDVQGQVLQLDTAEVMTVAGVFRDFPDNTTFKGTEFLLPWTYLVKMGWVDEYWGNNSVTTYVELSPEASHEAVNSKIRDIGIRHTNGEGDTEVFLHALPDWWLWSTFENGQKAGGRIETVRLFVIIAGFILLIACINFMNLSTARSEKRAKEVGIRKVAGAYRGSLVGQFLSESILIATLAGIIALGIVTLALPAFGSLVDRQLAIDFSDFRFWLSLIGFVLLTGILAGSYPAFYLSAFQPVKVLKGSFRRVNAAINPRKVLVVLQFTIAIVLIISTLVVHRQIQHAKDREQGYEKNNLLYTFTAGDVEKNYTLIKSELLNDGLATSVTKTSSPITESWSNSWGFSWAGKAEDDKTVFNRFYADDRVVETMGLELVAGRDFDLMSYPTDSTAAILNEAAVKAMGFDDPIGKIVSDNGTDWHVVGVIKDFIIQSPYSPIQPMVIEGARGWFSAVHIKYDSSISTAEALTKTEAIFRKYNPMYPFEYRFADEQYARKFDETQRTGSLAALFAFLTIFISCLGLFGLAAYMAENRTKEIGVRKVLGASVFSITKLLSKEFVVLVLISCLIAFPVAYWAMDKFLQGYNYRISLGWGIFVMAGLGAILLATFTVAGQAIKAAVANPVESLRDE